MKANELRIGNIICSKGTDETGIYIIEVIYKDYCLGKYEKITHRVRQCFDGMKGIPLTEEWLLKLGFEFYEGEMIGTMSMNDNWTLGLFKINAWGNGWLFYWDDKFDNRLQYVHQLQNLYFALTGNELEIMES